MRDENEVVDQSVIDYFKQSLESYKSLFDSVGEAIYIQDKQGKFLEVNQAAIDMYGYEKSFYPGKCAIDLTPEEKVDEAALRKLFKRALTGEPQHFELWGKRSNGEVFPKEVRLNPARYFGKQVVIGSVRDITEQKMAQESMEYSLKEKEILLSEIHHRVKNNLAVIVGMIELQRFNTEDETARRILSDSQSRINSMALIHEKLYQSENLIEIRFDTYIEELIGVIFDSLISRKQASKINLEIDAEPITFTITQAIPCGLLLNEIVTNSLKYAFPDKDGGTIRVQLSRIGDQIQFVISDNGVGLPVEVLQGKSNTLGFKLITSFSRQLEGDLVLSSESGTRFELTFRDKSN
jgi:PAS domain S-box-containing protein